MADAFGTSFETPVKPPTLYFSQTQNTVGGATFNPETIIASPGTYICICSGNNANSERINGEICRLTNWLLTTPNMYSYQYGLVFIRTSTELIGYALKDQSLKWISGTQLQGMCGIIVSKVA